MTTMDRDKLEEWKRIAGEALPLWDDEWDDSTPVELAAVEAFMAFPPANVLALISRVEELERALDIKEGASVAESGSTASPKSESPCKSEGGAS